MSSRFEWTDVRTVSDAIAQLRESGDGKVMLKAGGVDVIDRLKEGLDKPTRLVNIRNIAGLDKITEDASGVKIGPMVTLAQLDESPVIRRKYTALADAAGHAATPQIRNQATVGGNLLQRPRCWYFRSQDFHCLKKGGARCFAQEGENEYHAVFGNKVCAIVHPSAAGVALMALGAKLEITGGRGKREVAIENFWVRPEDDIRRENSLGADEVITSINIPAQGAGVTSAYMKIGEKESFDWPISEVAAVIEMSGANVGKASIILGAAAPVPLRLRQVEAALAGKPLNEESARAAAALATQGATPLDNNEYKLPIIQTMVRRTILAAGMKKGRANA